LNLNDFILIRTIHTRGSQEPESLTCLSLLKKFQSPMAAMFLKNLHQSNNTSLETYLPSLMKFCSTVLQKKMKMLFLIGFQCKVWPQLAAILKLQMAQKVTTPLRTFI